VRQCDLVRHDLAFGTAGHAVIFGGPYQRDQPGYPKSYTSVQLVRYDLIPRPPRSIYVRPATMQQLRALTHLSPTTRDPYAAPFGAPGGQAPVLGPILAMPQAARIWHFSPARSGSVNSRLTIFNPNSRAIDVAATMTKGGRTIHKRVHVPGLSDLEIVLRSWGAAEGRAALGLESASTFIPLLTTGGTGHASERYGQLGSTAVTTTTTAPRPAGSRQTPRPAGSRQTPRPSVRPARPHTVVVTAGTLYVRAAPSLQARIRGVVHRDNRLLSSRTEAGWDAVSLPDGTHGWVSARWVR